MPVSPSSSSSSASSSDSETEMKSQLKIKSEESDTSADSSSDDESDASSSDTKPVKQAARKSGAENLRKKAAAKDDVKVKVEDEQGEAVANEELEDVQVLSHKQQRRLKKKQTAATASTQNEDDDTTKGKDKKTKTLENKGKDAAPPRRMNSIWVGNLSFRTTANALRSFFIDTGVGEVMRLNMPLKKVIGVTASGPGTGTKKAENKGFAYVDFATPEAKMLAIALSEKNLDGRRLLIKDGDDFTGRPTAPSTPTTQPGTDGKAPGDASKPIPGLSKTAKKILDAQKQPPGPCLFLGNLGFETTDESIREMFEGRARAVAEMRAKKKGKRRREEEEEDEGDEEGEGEDEEDVDVGIKKVRMGTFEDSGLCKGFAFVDFKSTQHATTALTNPRNHSLNGRALVVEYASPDAVRRGGHRLAKMSGEDKYAGKKKRIKIEGQEGSRDENANANIEDDNERKVEGHRDDRGHSHDEARKERRRPGRVDERDSKYKRRQRPGAALALAQREKFAIVPSEGTRLKFS